MKFLVSGIVTSLFILNAQAKVLHPVTDDTPKDSIGWYHTSLVPSQETIIEEKKPAVAPIIKKVAKKVKPKPAVVKRRPIARYIPPKKVEKPLTELERLRLLRAKLVRQNNSYSSMRMKAMRDEKEREIAFAEEIQSF
ncbi:MAG: hypothetical protein ACPGJV_11305 [Bacteriovoracaceae bacterium]